jgi:hypothetical protein
MGVNGRMDNDQAFERGVMTNVQGGHGALKSK